MHEASNGPTDSPISGQNAGTIGRINEENIRNSRLASWTKDVSESRLLGKAKADHEISDIVFENISYRVRLGLFGRGKL